jgi:hypothetical protein
MQLEFEDFKSISEFHKYIHENFPDNYDENIKSLIDGKNDDISKETLIHLNRLLLNDFLNRSHLFTSEELEYLSEVRSHNSNLFKSINEKINEKKDQEFLSRKGELTTNQVKKYTKLPEVDRNKIEKFTTTNSYKDGIKLGFILGAITISALALVWEIFN